LRLGGVTGFWELDKVWPNSLAVGLAVDPSEPYVTVSGGYLAADVDFGGGPRDWAGGLDAFVVQYDHSGHYRWDHTWGSAGQDSMNGLAVDADGNLYGAGAISGATDFGGGPRPTAGSTTRYLARFDLAGTYAWDATWGVASGDFNSGPPAVGAGLAFFIGSATAAIDADPGAGTLTLLPRGDYDGVLVALNANTGRF
ncbi:MAG TPA: hypothetical protein VEI97_14910, partial [bacterium]|nr:hypothetical protein [bacterium]